MTKEHKVMEAIVNGLHLVRENGQGDLEVVHENEHRVVVLYDEKVYLVKVEVL